uniref:Uncharacterized protein n=1 Tax=Anguilla anguilla TaxID=7936 RepID=A0A0E9Y150_ANGAN
MHCFTHNYGGTLKRLKNN